MKSRNPVSAEENENLYIVTLVLGATLTTLTVAPYAINSFNAVKLIVITIFACIILYGFRGRRFQFRLLSDKKVFILLLGVLIALFISLIFNPATLYRKLVGEWGRNNGLLHMFSLIVILSFSSIMPKDKLAIKFLTWLSSLGTILACYGIFQLQGIDFLSYGASSVSNPVLLTFGNINFSSAFMSMTVIASIATAQVKTQGAPSERRWMFLRLLAITLQIYILYRADSSQGVISLAIALTLYSFFLARNLKSRTFRMVLPVGLASILVILAVGVFGRGPGALLLASGQRSIQDRYYHWIAAFNMFKDNLVFGVGIDSFGDWYRNYRLQESIDFRGTSEGFTNDAHSVFFQLLATGGLVLTLPLLLLIIFVFVRGIRSSLKEPHDYANVGVFCIWVAYFAQSMVSIEQAGIASWGWLAAGISLSSYTSQKLIDSSKLGFSARSNVLNLETPKSKRTKEAYQKTYMYSHLAFFGMSASILLVTVSLLIPAQYLEWQIKRQIISLGELSESRVEDSNELKSQSATELLALTKRAASPEVRFYALSELLQSGFIDEALDLATITTEQFPRSWDAWDAVAFIYENTGRETLAIEARKNQFALDPLNKALEAKILENTP